MLRSKRWLLPAFYALATIQVAWCYLWLTRPYVNTYLYERGHERMPFQGRCLMMLPMRFAHSSTALRMAGKLFAISHFWFPRPVVPEVLVQAAINVGCLALTGVLTTRIYQASSRRQLLTLSKGFTGRVVGAVSWHGRNIAAFFCNHYPSLSIAFGPRKG